MRLSEDELQNILASFNPRAHAGRDQNTLDCRASISLFQSTRPRGARHDQCDAAGSSFNPRAHAGRDAQADGQDHDVSIHAPTRGATGSSSISPRSQSVSIHAPTRGAT